MNCEDEKNAMISLYNFHSSIQYTKSITPSEMSYPMFISSRCQNRKIVECSLLESQNAWELQSMPESQNVWK